MVCFAKEVSQAAFLQRLKSIEEIAYSRNLLLNTDLSATERSGAKWILLCIASPFAALFCQDAFSHVRINNVMENFYSYLRKNADYIREPDTRYITDKIIAPLKAKTGAKYPMAFESISSLFHGIIGRRNDEQRWARDEQRWTQMTDAERTAVFNVCRYHAGFFSSLSRILPTQEEREIYRDLTRRFGEHPNPPLRQRT